MDNVERMKAKMGSPDEALARLRRIERSVHFAHRHLEEWRLAYPNMWFAVFEARLVGSARSRHTLFKQIEAEGLPLDEVYIDFIPEDSAELVL